MSAHKLAELLTRAAKRAGADNDLEVECPYCHNTFSLDQRSDPETSGTGDEDDQNEQDGEGPAEWDNVRRIDRLNALAKSLAAASNESK